MEPTSLLCWCLGTSGPTRALRAAHVRDRCKSFAGKFYVSLITGIRIR